ncbi:MAG TPA: hypothetical protein VMV10_25370 [Pirellulales bacterium]|nr:hypothetical protein [Pirellulales bacterium]
MNLANDWRVVLLAIGCIADACGATAADQAQPAVIRLSTLGEGQRVFDVTGLSSEERTALADFPQDDAAWQARFAVYALADRKAGVEGRPAMVGSYALDEGRLRFAPRYRLDPGVIYRAVYRPAEREAAPITADFEIPAPRAARPTKLAAIYPSRDRLPENQLKFYLHFSAPMSRGEAYEHVQLLDAQGRPIELPFLELGEELWDREAKRFTLFFDPGRIKRGLKPREEVGPAIEEGKSYTLVIDAGWRDAAGRPLAAEVRKTFAVGPPDDTPLDAANWKLDAPAGGREPLVVEFPEPLDHALLGRLLYVERGGEPVAGEIAIDQQETRWRFTPRDAWRPGSYDLVAGKELEDLAGNSLARPFEIDELKPVTLEVTPEFVRVPFEVK